MWKVAFEISNNLIKASSSYAGPSVVSYLLQQIKERCQNVCHLQTTSQNDCKSNQHFTGAYVNIHTTYEISMIKYVGRRANQGKVPKWLPFENCKPELLNI